MECGRHQVTLPHQDRVSALAGKDLHVWANVSDSRRTNENRFERIAAERPCQVTNETVDLPAIGVALYRHIDSAEASLRRILHVRRQQDGSRTGAEGRAEADKLRKLVHKALLFQVPQESTRFAARNYQGRDIVELFRIPYQNDFRAKLFKAAPVGIEIALQRKNTDFHN